MRRRPVILPFLAALLAATASDGAVLRVPSPYPSIQSAVDVAFPGDTILVATGDYGRRVTVDAVVRIRAEAPGVRLAGLTGAGATLEGLHFDAALAADPSPLVVAGPGLRLEDCTFTGTGTGLRIEAGAGGVEVRGGRIEGMLRAVDLTAPAGTTLLEDLVIEGSVLGVLAPDSLLCAGSPANRCAGDPCAEIVLRRVTIRGGETALTAGTGTRLVLDACRLAGAVTAVRARGTRIELRDSTLEGLLPGGTGVLGESVSGVIERTRFDGLAVACDLGDGGTGCGAASDLRIGGSLAAGNTFDGNHLHLRVRQTTPIAADFNHWGSFSCATVAATLEGQSPGIIADALFHFTLNCTTPAGRESWGGVKTRFASGGAP